MCDGVLLGLQTRFSYGTFFHRIIMPSEAYRMKGCCGKQSCEVAHCTIIRKG